MGDYNYVPALYPQQRRPCHAPLGATPCPDVTWFWAAVIGIAAFAVVKGN